VYALDTARALDRNVVAQSFKGSHASVGTVAVFQISGPDDLATGMVLRAVKKALDKTASASRDVEILRGKQRGILGLLHGTLLVTWLHAADDKVEEARVAHEADQLSPLIEKLLQQLAINGEKLEAHAVVSAPLSAADQRPSAAQWRYLLGKALEQMQPTL
jgi:hypothetical protein